MEVKVHDFWFLGKMTPPLVASQDGGIWSKADTSAAGSPTLLGTNGYMVATLDNTNEIQNLCLYFGDSLAFAFGDLMLAEFWLKVGGTFAASDSLAFGMASARNDAIDSIAAHASFRLLGDGSTNPITCESDDAVHDVDDVATGQVLSTTLKRFVIDFAGQLLTQAPPALSKGGKANVGFFMDDARGNLKRVCPLQQFDMSSYALTSGLQPYMQLQKTAATTTPSASLRRVRITERIGA